MWKRQPDIPLDCGTHFLELEIDEQQTSRSPANGANTHGQCEPIKWNENYFFES